MKCDRCGKKCTRLLMGIGAYCSDPCKQILIIEEERRRKKLLAEPMTSCPPKLSVGDFDRLMFKMALHCLRWMPDKVRRQIRKNNPLVLNPLELCLLLKEKALGKIPPQYVSLKAARGHARLFYSGTFRFRRKIPRRVVIQALLDSHIIKENRRGRGKRKKARSKSGR